MADTSFAALFGTIDDLPVSIAPDGLEVRVASLTNNGQVSEFRLAPDTTGDAIKHKTVTELWFLVSGHGTVWLGSHNNGEPKVMQAGEYFVVPPETEFQVRNDHLDQWLKFIALTMPSFPGDGEVIKVPGYWRKQ